MLISLIRHGYPDFWQDVSPYSFVSGHQIPALVNRYDQSGIQASPLPPDHVIDIARTAAVLYSSNLRRARESAGKLGVEEVIEHTVFREVELPIPILTFVRLPVFLWLILLRGLWLRGYSKSCKSVYKARLRSVQAAGILQDAARRYNTVALVGHGFMNRFIKQELCKAGWISEEKAYNHHWGCHQLYKSH